MQGTSNSISKPCIQRILSSNLLSIYQGLMHWPFYFYVIDVLGPLCTSSFLYVYSISSRCSSTANPFLFPLQLFTSSPADAWCVYKPSSSDCCLSFPPFFLLFLRPHFHFVSGLLRTHKTTLFLASLFSLLLVLPLFLLKEQRSTTYRVTSKYAV